MKTIKAIMVKPNETPKTTELKVSIDAFNKAVSVDSDYDCLARCKRLEKGVYVLRTDEDSSLFLAPNRKVGKEIIAGTFYVIAAKDGIPVSLDDKQTEKYMDRFSKIEEFSENEALLLQLNALSKELDEISFELRI